MNTNTEMSSAVNDNVVVADIICENEKNEKKKIEISFPNEDEAILPTTTTMSNISEMNNNDKINTDGQTKIKVKKVKDPNAPKKTKKSKLSLVVEEDVAVVMATPEPTHQPVVSATMEIPRSFHIDECVFEDETVVPEPTRKWVCGVCDRGGNYCGGDDGEECRHCRNELCRSCCNDRSVMLDDEPTIEECGTCGHYECQCEFDRYVPERIPYHMTHQVGELQCAGCGHQFNDISEVMSCPDCGAKGSTYDIPEPTDDEWETQANEQHEIKIQHEVWNDAHPFVNRDDDAGECEDCGARCELADDRLCHYCFHHGDPDNCWCVNCAEEDVDVDADTSDNCPVCYEATETRTRGCNHKLCVGCFETLKSGLASWERHVKCPICRTLFTDIQRQMTDAEKLADYDRLREENDRLMSQLNTAIAERDRMRMSRDVAQTRMETARAERRQRRRNARLVVDEDAEPVAQPARQPRQPRVPRASRGVLNVNEDEEDVVGVELNPREYGADRPALSSTRVVLEDGQRLADIPFSARPRLRCGRNGCVRRTRRCCDGCGNVRACEEHMTCEECM